MPSHTTLRLNEALLRRAKAYARRQDTTLTAVMERALAAYLRDDPPEDEPSTFRLPAFGRGGPHAYVDLDRTSTLLDLMDGLPVNAEDGAE